MYDRFTERARQVVVFAQEEARTLRFSHVGSEALLLGLLREEEGVAAKALESLGVGMNTLRDFDLDTTSIRDAVIERLAGFIPPNPPRRQRSRTRWRRAGRAEVGPSTDPFRGFDVRPNDEVTGVLIGAAARALEDGRTETTIGDLLIRLSRAERLRPVLPELAGGEARIRAALQRLETDEPPESANGS